MLNFCFPNISVIAYRISLYRQMYNSQHPFLNSLLLKFESITTHLLSLCKIGTVGTAFIGDVLGLN